MNTAHLPDKAQRQLAEVLALMSLWAAEYKDGVLGPVSYGHNAPPL